MELETLKNVENIWNHKAKPASQVSPYKNRQENKRSGKKIDEETTVPLLSLLWNHS